MKQFRNSEAYQDEEVYTIVTDEFNSLKSLGIIEDWVEIDDIYLNQDNDIYAVQHYHDTYFNVEGHGINTITESSPDMRTAVLVLTHTQVLKALHPEIFYNINV